jgi:hypothetical protein
MKGTSAIWYDFKSVNNQGLKIGNRVENNPI